MSMLWATAEIQIWIEVNALEGSMDRQPLSLPDGPRPTQKEVVSLRAFMLLFLKQLILKVNHHLVWLYYLSVCNNCLSALLVCVYKLSVSPPVCLSYLSVSLSGLSLQHICLSPTSVFPNRLPTACLFLLLLSYLSACPTSTLPVCLSYLANTTTCLSLLPVYYLSVSPTCIIPVRLFYLAVCPPCLSILPTCLSLHLNIGKYCFGGCCLNANSNWIPVLVVGPHAVSSL